MVIASRGPDRHQQAEGRGQRAEGRGQIRLLSQEALISISPILTLGQGIVTIQVDWKLNSLAWT
jgi:hypothetical protein